MTPPPVLSAIMKKKHFLVLVVHDDLGDLQRGGDHRGSQHQLQDPRHAQDGALGQKMFY